MNVIVSNKYQNMLATLDIDVIKSINGEFEVEELANIFTNFYFNKMIIDVTAIKGYQNIKNIQKLSVNFDPNKLILLLDDSAMVNSGRYLSSLVSMGIYNFTRNINAVKFLIDNPNSYKDVAQYHNLNGNSEDDDTSGLEYDSFTGTGSGGLRIVGFRNVTSHAGATTLVYMLKKHLEVAYNVVAIEVDKEDFLYLNDKSLKSTTTLDLAFNIANNPDAEVILVDLNDSTQGNLCNEIIYLIEPGLIKLNKLIRKDRAAFEKLKDKKIVLNKSVLTNKDINDYNTKSIYENLTYVPQETILLHSTIYENIRIAKPTASYNEIVAAAKKAELHNFIEKLDYKYDTIVGERGIKLSGGQRQRIALARIFLRDSKIVIFDEATSSLDNNTEFKIQQNIHKYFNNQTLICIAHRLSTLKDMDYIVVIDNGIIIDTGSPKVIIPKYEKVDFLKNDSESENV